ncbi:hypothetical protein GDO78_009348 [Eleutherodactylus coqui]|uniref:Uncharacterized protein n=1 Tax=Eleutherodactylus coqui TaxID=57060 RepID=A0A8J6K8U5_ELECQ|nr:hypothetical protein GDO78_009348 [Eleutherodactylus coqui]
MLYGGGFTCPCTFVSARRVFCDFQIDMIPSSVRVSNTLTIIYNVQLNVLKCLLQDKSIGYCICVYANDSHNYRKIV